MNEVSLIGCGFVADLYMRALATYPSIRVIGAHDRDPERLHRFCAHWGIPAFSTRKALFAAQLKPGLILNLTNPRAHAEANRACLEEGFHVWSEKPLATDMQDAHELHQLATRRGLLLASAPASVLGEAAQTLARRCAGG